jgi:peptidoglycan/LPS O-acetylase OafA/YrhL
LFWTSVGGLLILPVVLFLQPMLSDYALGIEIGVRLAELLFFSVIILAASRYGFAGVLSTRAMVIGGECSYSFYLLHPFLIRPAMIGNSDAPSLPEFLFRLCLFVAIVTAVAWLTHRLIEAPSRAWLRKALRTSAPQEVLRTT